MLLVWVSGLDVSPDRILWPRSWWPSYTMGRKFIFKEALRAAYYLGTNSNSKGRATSVINRKFYLLSSTEVSQNSVKPFLYYPVKSIRISPLKILKVGIITLPSVCTVQSCACRSALSTTGSCTERNRCGLVAKTGTFMPTSEELVTPTHYPKMMDFDGVKPSVVYKNKPRPLMSW